MACLGTLLKVFEDLFEHQNLRVKHEGAAQVCMYELETSRKTYFAVTKA